MDTFIPNDHEFETIRPYTVNFLNTPLTIKDVSVRAHRGFIQLFPYLQSLIEIYKHITSQHDNNVPDLEFEGNTAGKRLKPGNVYDLFVRHYLVYNELLREDTFNDLQDVSSDNPSTLVRHLYRHFMNREGNMEEIHMGCTRMLQEYTIDRSQPLVDYEFTESVIRRAYRMFSESKDVFQSAGSLNSIISAFKDGTLETTQSGTFIYAAVRANAFIDAGYIPTNVAELSSDLIWYTCIMRYVEATPNTILWPKSNDVRYCTEWKWIVTFTYEWLYNPDIDLFRIVPAILLQRFETVIPDTVKRRLFSISQFIINIKNKRVLDEYSITVFRKGPNQFLEMVYNIIRTVQTIPPQFRESVEGLANQVQVLYLENELGVIHEKLRVTNNLSETSDLRKEEEHITETIKSFRDVIFVEPIETILPLNDCQPLHPMYYFKHFEPLLGSRLFDEIRSNSSLVTILDRITLFLDLTSEQRNNIYDLLVTYRLRRDVIDFENDNEVAAILRTIAWVNYLHYKSYDADFKTLKNNIETQIHNSTENKVTPFNRIQILIRIIDNKFMNRAMFLCLHQIILNIPAEYRQKFILLADSTIYARNNLELLKFLKQQWLAELYYLQEQLYFNMYKNETNPREILKHTINARGSPRWKDIASKWLSILPKDLYEYFLEQTSRRQIIDSQLSDIKLI